MSGTEAPDTALYAFASNGQGGATWRRLTNIPRSPTPDIHRDTLGILRLPTGPNDDFASFQILGAVFDGTAWHSTHSLVRFANPFTRPASSVTLDQLQFFTSAGQGAEPNAHTWSPNGRVLAYIGRRFYPDGSSRAALRRLDTATGADAALLDSNTIGVQPNRPRWSPDGSEIAFDSNTYSNASIGDLRGEHVQRGHPRGRDGGQHRELLLAGGLVAGSLDPGGRPVLPCAEEQPARSGDDHAGPLLGGDQENWPRPPHADL